uniref:Coiled-coil domain-containing protein 39 n=1 Tax=Hucho hucho TaxID=62062 RepID=A0A4W5PFP4_9TELE
MVEDDILKLEIKSLWDLLYNKADKVLLLERRRLQLQMAMREQEEEITMHREMLSKQVKNTDQEHQGPRLPKRKRRRRSERWRTRSTSSTGATQPIANPSTK